MNARQMITLISAQPFLPLTIQHGEGAKTVVTHAHALATEQNADSCTVYDEKGLAQVIEFRNIAEVLVDAPSATSQSDKSPLKDDSKDMSQRPAEATASRYTVSVKHDGEVWTGWIDEMPEVKSRGNTRDELLASLHSALRDAMASEL